jgi:hypothetical protein
LRIGHVVAAVFLVDIAALDGAAGETLGGFDGGRERVAVAGIAGQRLDVQHELSAGSGSIGGDDGNFEHRLVIELPPVGYHAPTRAWYRVLRARTERRLDRKRAAGA